MAFDAKPHIAVLLQEIGRLSQRRLAVITDIGLVVVEVDVSHPFGKLFFKRLFSGRRWWRWRRSTGYSDSGRRLGCSPFSFGRNRIGRRRTRRNRARTACADVTNALIN